MLVNYFLPLLLFGAFPILAFTSVLAFALIFSSAILFLIMTLPLNHKCQRNECEMMHDDERDLPTASWSFFEFSVVKLVG